MARKDKRPRRSKVACPSEDGVIYGRYSSHSQRDVSIEQQIKEGMEHASRLGIRIVATYADRAVSGRSDNRPDFQRMMRDATEGKFGYVIAWKSNRIGRNMMEAMINEATLNSMGIRVIYTEEDFDDSAAGRFAARSMMNVNQFYSDAMSEDIRRGLEDNARKCMVNGAVGLGFKRGEDGRYAIDEPNAALVREIFERVATREPFVDICSDLNTRGLRTSTGKMWNRSSFHRMLVNERYRGVYLWGDSRIEDGVPRIVSDELFYRVQEVLKTKNNAPGRYRSSGEYLLTGKLFCGKCGSPMSGISGTSKTGAMHYYYICQKRRHEKTCDKANVRRDRIELAVASAIRTYVLQDDVIEWIADRTVAYYKEQSELSPVAALENNLADVRRSLKNIMAAIEQGIFTETTKDRLLELEAEQTRLVAKIEAEKGNAVSISKDDIIAGLEMYRDGDINSKRYQAKLFDTFLVSVYVYEDDMRITFSFTGKDNTVTVPLDASFVENVENEPGAESSFRLSTAPPHVTQTNSAPCIYAVGSLFVLVCPLDFTAK